MFKKNIKRGFSNLLKERIRQLVPEVQTEVRTILKNHGNLEIGKITLDSVIMGMKELPLMFYPCSSLDPKVGIRFRGMSIDDMQEKLPKIGNQPIPESVFWLLMTGEVPTDIEVKDLQDSLTNDTELPQRTVDLVNNYAKTHHPMTVLSMAILDLQKDSVFFKRYGEGSVLKKDYWEPTFDDSITILKFLPRLAGLIYTTKFNKQPNELINSDWAGQYANYLGHDSFEMAEILRGYLAIHTDHEGGNISAHSGYIASSALCDSYLSFTNAINGLAGPLHGLANQEVLKFLLKMQTSISEAGLDITKPGSYEVQAYIKKYVKNWLKSAVIPGYGHGRLRTTDPRYTHLKNLSSELIPDKNLVKLIHSSEEIITNVLTDLGKVKNPNPNVDAHSGVLLYELGLKEFEYYTVVFAVSRAMGVFSNTIWARAIGLPLERPGSVTLEQIKDMI